MKAGAGRKTATPILPLHKNLEHTAIQKLQTLQNPFYRSGTIRAEGGDQPAHVGDQKDVPAKT